MLQGRGGDGVSARLGSEWVGEGHTVWEVCAGVNGGMGMPQTRSKAMIKSLGVSWTQLLHTSTQ